MYLDSTYLYLYLSISLIISIYLCLCLSLSILLCFSLHINQSLSLHLFLSLAQPQSQSQPLHLSIYLSVYLRKIQLLDSRCCFGCIVKTVPPLGDVDVFASVLDLRSLSRCFHARLRAAVGAGTFAFPLGRLLVTKISKPKAVRHGRYGNPLGEENKLWWYPQQQ